MTVDQMIARLQKISAAGNGDQPLAFSATRKVSDGRRRSGYRFEQASWTVRAACTGSMVFAEGGESYTEVLAGEQIHDWR